MVRKTIYILLIFISASLSSFAQPTVDTIVECLKQKPQLLGKFDSHNSFINNSRAKIFGVKAGLSFGKRISFAIGYNQLQPPAEAFNKTIYVPTANNELTPVVSTLHLYYFSIQTEYVFYQTKHWELSTPIQFGVGKNYYSYVYADKKNKIEKYNNFVYEPAVSVEYKFFKWFGLGADLGYRFILTNHHKLNRQFTSPTYAFKFLIYYDEIFKSLLALKEKGFPTFRSDPDTDD